MTLLLRSKLPSIRSKDSLEGITGLDKARALIVYLTKCV